MDITRDVIYRNFKLNDASISDSITPGGAIGSGITGCVLDSGDISDADVVQATEKRSLQDGLDAGDVYLGGRRVRLAGTLYGRTRALLFDAHQELKRTLSPTLAQRESPLDKGYLPLYFSVPTNRVADYPLGAIDLRVLAMPRAFASVFQRDQIGGNDGDALAIPWQATMVMRDPRIMSDVQVDTVLTNAVQGGTQAGNVVNRGDYHAPLNMLLKMTASGPSVVTVAIGGSNFQLTVPLSTGDRIVRVKGEDKIVTIEEGGVEALRMDVITFQNNTTWPLVPAGTSPYSIACSTTGIYVGGLSHFWFWESFA